MSWFLPTTGPAAPIPATEGSDNLAFGIPGPADTIVDREGYALGYSEYHEQPLWVIYHMTAEEATNKATSRDSDQTRQFPPAVLRSPTIAAPASIEVTSRPLPTWHFR